MGEAADNATSHDLPSLDSLAERRRDTYRRNDPTATLVAEHEWLENALIALRTMASCPGRMGPGLTTVFRELEIHIRKEEDVYFPALAVAYKAAGRHKGLIDDMIGEHDGIRVRREELESAIAGQRPLDRAIAAFNHALAVHFEHEEDWVLAGAVELLAARAAEIVENFERLDP